MTGCIVNLLDMNRKHRKPSLFNLSAQNHIFPYRIVDSNLVFHNHQSYGCGIRLSLQSGDHAELRDLVFEMRSMLPEHVDITIILHKHQYLEPILHHNDDSPYFHPQLNLHDLQCYVFLSTRHSKHALMVSRKKIELKLDGSRKIHARLSKIELLVLTRSWLTHPTQTQPGPIFADIHLKELHTLIPPTQTIIHTYDEYIDIQHLDAMNQQQTLRVVNCHSRLLHTSESFQHFTWPRPELLIPCPFWISLTLRSTHHHINCFQNIALMSEPRSAQAHWLECQQYYHQWGYQLKPVKGHQRLLFFAGFPFFISEGYDQALQHTHQWEQHTPSRVLHRMPITSDYKGASQGLFLPTETGQIAFLNLFDRKCCPENTMSYLFLCDKNQSASFQEALIQRGLSLGERIFLFDSNTEVECSPPFLMQTIDIEDLSSPIFWSKTRAHLTKIKTQSTRHWPSILSSLIEYCEHIPNTVKTHIFLPATEHSLLNAVLAIQSKISLKKTRIGVFLNNFQRDSGDRTLLETIRAFDFKIIFGKKMIQTYAQIFSADFCLKRHAHIASFDERAIPGYDNVFIQSGSKQSFHRFHKRRRSCKVR